MPNILGSSGSMKALYLSHTGMTEPLGRSQVLPYLRGIARSGWCIDLVAFEPASATSADLVRLRQALAQEGIAYSFVRRSESHELAVKGAESVRAFSRMALRALAGRPRIIHARSYLPGAVALAIAQMIPRARFIFDCRGLLGDEYVDAGHWTRDSIRYRLVKRAERWLFGRADAVVVLTNRLRCWLSDEVRLTPSHTPIEVIPCCVDLARFRRSAEARDEARRRIAAEDQFVLVYSGSLGSWYCEEEIARFFAALRRRRPARLLVLTRSPTERLRAALQAMGIADEDIRFEAVAPDDMPRVLGAADGALSFIRPVFSKLASSPVKLAEYLALGIPVALNRGIGDVDHLLEHSDTIVDAGRMSPDELERAAARMLALDPLTARTRGQELAARYFSLEEGVSRYCRLYERLAG